MFMSGGVRWVSEGTDGHTVHMPVAGETQAAHGTHVCFIKVVLSVTSHLCPFFF